MDHLDRLPIHYRKAGAPGFVSSDDLVKALLERDSVERTGQVNGHALVIHGAIGRKLGEEPHLLLPKGQGQGTSRGTLGNVARSPGPLREISSQILFEQGAPGFREIRCIWHHVTPSCALLRHIFKRSANPWRCSVFQDAWEPGRT